MSEILTVMEWPLLACLLLPGLLVYFGLHIVRRGIIFVDLALAQVAALGTSLAIVLHYDTHSWQAFALSLLFTFVGAILFTFTRGDRHARVPQEALIGIVYVVAAALGLLLLSQSAEGNEELRRTLIGDVLLVSREQVEYTFLLYLGVSVVHYLFRSKFFQLSFLAERDQSSASIRMWDFLFYALFGLVVTSFVQIGGVLLVFSYLIIPAVCANYVTQSFRLLLFLGWLTATLASITGLYLSFTFDFPTGATIVCALGAALVGFIFFARRDFSSVRA